MIRTILHFTHASDTSGYFPQLAVCHDRRRFRMIFGTLQRLDPRLRDHMEGHGVRCLDCACPARWAYPAGLLRLVAFLRRHRVDILHTHLFDPSVIGLTGGYLARTPARVVTRHYSDLHTRITRPVHVWLDRLCTQMSHRVIAVSQDTANHLVRVEGAPPAKVRVVHNGIDFERVRLSSPEAPARIRAELDLIGRPVLLAAARMNPEKGYDHLLAALPRVLAQVPDLVLLIAGGGPLEPRYQALIAASGLERSVRFLGFRNDIPDVIAASDVLVLPSLSEAFGLVLAEALYLGVPVVASRVGGIPEIVDDGVDGLLVPPGDDAALARSLVQLFVDHEHRRRLGGAGREKIASRFGFREMVGAYERLYDELDRRPC